MTKLRQLLETAVFAAFFLAFAACQLSPTCHDVNGRWSNREGRTVIMEPNKEARWVIKFGSQSETFAVKYEYDCKATPATLDFHDFQWGPLRGRSLYGIIEWTSDSTFRYQSDPGTSPAARPKEFTNDLAITFYREKEEKK